MDEEQRMRHNYVQTITALYESVKLQGHYAQLLNNYDNGNRKVFKTVTEWLERLVETNTIQPLIKE